MADILVTKYDEYPVVATYIDNRLEHLSVVHGSDVGNIYLCRVENVVKNISSVFVRYDDDKTGYISSKGILTCNVVNRSLKTGEAVRQGDEIILQVDTEEQKLKKAKLTSALSVSGKYTVATLGKKGLGVSKKLSSDERKLLTDCSKDIYEKLIEKIKDITSENIGIIIRTETSFLSQEEMEGEISKDMRESIFSLLDILKNGRNRTVFSCLYTGRSNELEDHVLRAKNFLKAQGLEDYNVIESSVVYSMKTDLEKLLKNRIWLKSGAFLVIEQLESFNAIDVNTGKAITGKSDIIKKVNKEAALEIFRQIRLRNLTGMILIDFINMKDKSDTEELCSYLKFLCSKEAIHTEFIDITGLGIVELTRTKNDKSLKEIIGNHNKPVDNHENE